MNAKVSRSILAGICAGSLAVPANAGEWCTDVDGDGVVGLSDLLAALAGFNLPGPADIDMRGVEVRKKDLEVHNNQLEVYSIRKLFSKFQDLFLII